MDARRILITGCVRSYAAGIAMKPLLEGRDASNAGRCDARCRISRHLPSSCLEEGPGRLWCVLISVSGTVTRIPGRSAQRANLHGANTLAILHPQHPVGVKKRECRRALELNPPRWSVPPARGLCGQCCHALLALYCHMGRVPQPYVPAMEDVYRGACDGVISGSSHQKYQLPIAPADVLR